MYIYFDSIVGLFDEVDLIEEWVMDCVDDGVDLQVVEYECVFWFDERISGCIW